MVANKTTSKKRIQILSTQGQRPFRKDVCQSKEQSDLVKRKKKAF